MYPCYSSHLSSLFLPFPPLALYVIKSQNGCISFTNICRLRLPQEGRRTELQTARERGERGQRHGKVQYWIPARPAGSPFSLPTNLRRQDHREVRIVYINLITQNDVTSERPRPPPPFFGAYQERINTAKRLHPHPHVRMSFA